jgi:hypothetical protein
MIGKSNSIAPEFPIIVGQKVEDEQYESLEIIKFKKNQSRGI